MRMTKREKILIIALLFFIAGYFLFRYIITPQLAELSVLRTGVAEWEAQKQSLAVVSDTIAQADQRKDDLETEIQVIGNTYFASLDDQEELIIVLNDLLRSTGLKDTELSFDKLSDASFFGNDSDAAAVSGVSAPLVQKVRLTYEGTYDSLWNTLRAFWNFNKCIQVDSISISQDAESAGILTGEIDLSFYDLSEMTSIRDTMVVWSDTGAFRKADPFQAISGEAFPGTRYILNVDDETDKYIKFVDITGNWAEAAIDDFGERHLITGDSANRYFPDEPITRGEFVMLLDQYYHWEAPENPVDLTKFSDYTELGQSLSAMEKAFYKGNLLGFFVGYGDGSLRPNAPTSYHEFELVMGRILGQPDFNWKDAALAMEQETAYTSPGISDDSASITRAEAVYFLHSLPQA